MNRPTKIDLLFLSMALLPQIICLFFPYCRITDWVPGTDSDEATYTTVYLGYQSVFPVMNVIITLLFAATALIRNDKPMQMGFQIALTSILVVVTGLYHLLREFPGGGPFIPQYENTYYIILLTDIVTLVWSWVKVGTR